MSTKKLLSFTLIVILSGLTGFNLKAQTRPAVLYVDAASTASTPDGSEQSPFKTIRQALDYRQGTLGLSGMASDEEILVKAGNYYPTASDLVIINRYNAGYGSYWLTVRSESPLGAVLKGDSLYTQKYAAIVAITDSAVNVRLKGFVVEGIRNNPSLVDWLDSSGDSVGSPTVPIGFNLFGDTVYSARKDVKYGIQVAMDVRNVEILDNEIRDISWTSEVDPYDVDTVLSESEKNILRGAWPLDNAGPISVLGSDEHAMQNILIKGNKVHHCIPGWTEAVAVNGYLDGFEISGNEIHNIRNIGIVAAGNYSWVVNDPNFSTPSTENYARNGLIKGNKVYDCRSPIAVSAGIYLDGSRDVVVENNEVYNNHVGFSIGNETYNSHSGGHIIRNNLSHDNQWAGMVLGSNGQNAWVENVKVLGNTFVDNNVNQTTILGKIGSNGFLEVIGGVVTLATFTGSGELIMQKLSNSTSAPNAKIEIKNNIFKSRTGVMVNANFPFKTDSYGSSDLTISNLDDLLEIDYNFYYPKPGENINYNYYNAGFTGNTYNFANYKTQTGLDANSGTHELGGSDPLPAFFDTNGAGSDAYRLASGAAPINAGDPSAGSGSGETDFAGNARIYGSTIDIGAFESGSVAPGDIAATIDGINGASEDYLALQTGVSQGIWKNVHAYDDNHFIYIYGEYDGTLAEYSIFVNVNSGTGHDYIWTEKSDFYVDGTLNLLNVYDTTASPSWPFSADNSVMTVRFVKTDSTIEGRIPKYTLGVGSTGTVGLGLEGHSANWASSLGSIPLEDAAMVYLTLDGGSEAGSLSVDGYKSPVENYGALITGVTGSSFKNIYGHADTDYIYLYAEIDHSSLREYNVYLNINSSTGHQYLWSDKSDYYIDANYNQLNEYVGGGGWPFDESENSAGIEFIMTPTAIEGKILKSLIGVGSSGTIGIGLEGHTANWGSSLGGVPTSGSMVYLSLAGGSGSRVAVEQKVAMEEPLPALLMYPNPTTDYLRISHHLDHEGLVRVEVIGLDGRQYLNSQKLLEAGNHVHEIPVGNIPKGILMVRVTANGEVRLGKVIHR